MRLLIKPCREESSICERRAQLPSRRTQFSRPFPSFPKPLKSRLSARLLI